MVDDDDAVAQGFQIAGVVRGEQHADVFEPGHLADRVPDVLLGDHVQADGWLVEQDQLRAVEERGGHLTAHPLAEGKFPHGSLQQILDLECLGELVDALLRVAVVHLVDLAEEGERVDGGQVIPELRALTEDRADVIGKLLAFLPGDVTQAPLPRRWLDAGCLSAS